MSQESELKRLEGFISKLLVSFRELKEENGGLIQDLQDRDETIVTLREQLAVNDAERNEINNRVIGIIDQIEEWEIELGEEVLTDVPVNDPSRQGNLFSSVDAADKVSDSSQQEGNKSNDY